MSVADINNNPKTALNKFCQVSLKRPVTKADCEYTCTKQGAGFQCTLKLLLSDGQEPNIFVAEGTAKKEAEQAVAAVALATLGVDMEQYIGGAKKRKATDAGFPGAAPELGVARSIKLAGEALNDKVRLNTVIMKILKRAITKGEMAFTTETVSDGTFQSTLKIETLPEPWCHGAFCGPVCATEKEAEIAVCTEALSNLTEDPSIATIIAESAKRKPSGTAKNNAGGGGNQWGQMGQMMQQASTGAWGGEWKTMFEQMQTMMAVKGGGGGKGGWGSGGKKTADTKRERISETPAEGTVVEWKGSFGWLQANEPIEHPSANKRGGKIFVHVSDLKDGKKELTVGASVFFQVYTDSSGLGADEVFAV